jgi:hypothetical protein
MYVNMIGLKLNCSEVLRLIDAAGVIEISARHVNKEVMETLLVSRPFDLLCFTVSVK